ncbi:MAG: hypothetical protein B7Y36_04235 [Novosphingobium sp. 28-62-57]|nr:MAG: hypothetical protein B7Z34_03905 [Novosphingobium sp. 12-62-10]OYZ11384.1 MAG: hypothetical protein B7Y36_04235 [Novosphingobium sp. 28-62-57]OZA33001.1 MAG: hypothetical protein B7X92_11885 [Novosphingobium sp. 17-62-9]
MARIILSHAARGDLVEIGEYGEAQFGSAIADSYQDDIERSLDLLADFPLSGEAKDVWGDGVRSLVCNRHRIVYRYGDDTVQVLRILHHSRNVPQHLRP